MTSQYKNTEEQAVAILRNKLKAVGVQRSFATHLNTYTFYSEKRSGVPAYSQTWALPTPEVSCYRTEPNPDGACNRWSKHGKLLKYSHMLPAWVSCWALLPFILKWYQHLQGVILITKNREVAQAYCSNHAKCFQE